MGLARTTFAAAVCGVALSASRAHAAKDNRLYIKSSGAIMFALDTSGHLYTRSNEEYGVTTAHTGMQFRRSGAPFMALRSASTSDRDQNGRMAIGGGYVYQNFSVVPYQPSGSFVFYYKAVGSSSKTGMMEIDPTDGSVDVRGNYDSRFAYRQNVVSLKQSERTNLLDAWKCTDNTFYPGSQGGPDPSDPNQVGGVSYWDKQQQIHYSYGEHSMSSAYPDRNPAFLPWHREFVNRLEDQLRVCDPLVSIPYWDWTSSPFAPAIDDGVPLLTGGNTDDPTGWFGSGYGHAGGPFATFESTPNYDISRSATANPADPPFSIARYASTIFSNPTDADLIGIPNLDSFIVALEAAHGNAHGAIGGDGGTMGDIMRSTEDPFFFLLHSNVDRIWATWQRDPAQSWRLTATGVFGQFSVSWPTNWPLKNLNGMYMGRDVMDPWSGGIGYMMGSPEPMRPWMAPDNAQAAKSYIDTTIVNPRQYETPDGNGTI